MIKQELKTWLLNPDDPSLQFRVMTELLDISETEKEITAIKKQISGSKPVQKIFGKIHPDGYWLQKNPRTKKIVGDGVEYGSFATTHFCLSYLSELGLTKEHPLIEKASERYLNLMNDDGDWWEHMSCLLGYNIRTFVKLGYKNDKRLQKAIQLLLNTNRPDGGYLCDMHEKYGKRKKKKSCIRGSAKALLALSDFPEHWNHPRCKELIQYFLNRNGIYNSQKTEFANKDMLPFSFPMTWGTNSWEILFALSKMGLGNDERLANAWDFIKSKQNKEGKYLLDYTPTQSPWKVGKKGEPNKWVTFYVLLAYKNRSGNNI